VAAPSRTRIGADRRRAQILAATHRVTLRRGLHDLRVADVAAELGVSTGLIHYHFATRDELLGEMLRATAEREISEVERRLGRLDGPAERLDAAIEAYLPSARRDASWVLWIDAWGEALRDANVRRISEELDASWVRLFEAIVVAGVEHGVFHTDDPGASAWRLCSLLDGLGLQVVLHQSTMNRMQMGRHVRLAASRELGYEPAISG
jgi:AcrR family transcriptional regulator